MKNSNKIRIILNIFLAIILIIVSNETIISCFFNETLVEVPNVVNMNKDEATKVLKKLKLKANIISSRSLDVPINYVYSQSPESGVRVKKNRGIKLYINDDKGDKVPDLKGKTLVEAMDILEKDRIEIISVDYIFSSTSNNEVLAVYPKENTRLAVGTKVSLLVSTKDSLNSNRMPNIVGLDVNEANNILSQIGYKISEVSRISNTTFPENVIVSTEPSADMPLDKNVKIKVLISEVTKNVKIEDEKIKQERIDEIIKNALSESEKGSE